LKQFNNQILAIPTTICYRINPGLIKSLFVSLL
jgi:hypothetical protein